MSRLLPSALLLALVLIVSPVLGAVLSPPSPKVVASTTFLADMAQNVAGSRLSVKSLVPIGVEPHGFEPAPADMRVVADCNVLIVNGFGLEGSLDRVLQNVGGNRLVVEAASGLTPRNPEGHEVNMHFWLDPNLAIRYVENIRDGLAQADPEGASSYAANAEAYIARLKGLDAWIIEQVAQIPPERRLLVTNHESLGHFADRYGFQVVGTVVPNVSPGATPSARELADLVDHVRRTGAPAIFLETGANRQLADQVAREAGVRVETGLYTHSVSEASGPAATYIDMIRHNVNTIVSALR